MSVNRIIGVAMAATFAGVSWGADGSFTPSLEEITVTALQSNGTSLGGTTITQTDIREFNRDTLDSAILLASGASVSEVGPRNETDIWIRGFDRWRVPLYQDGIPIYLPVDNRIDFGRFTTIDLAEIQVSKGFASVIDGPGAMGGSVNLVSRLVQQPLEGDVRAGMTLDSTGSYQGWQSDLFAGTRQSNWFAQGAGSFTSQSHFRLSDGFTPGTYQPDGDRLDSQHQDYKINLKAGYVPDAKDEFAINFVDQVGYKGNPVVDSLVPAALQKTIKFWDWPAWDKKSLYFLSQNALDDRGSYLKTRVYYDRFFNQLDSYDSIAYDTQNTPKAFNSTYDDHAAGATIELAESLPDIDDTVRAALHYRWDQHKESESTRNAPFATFYVQPWETAEESTSSAALENIYHPTAAWDVTAGLSFDHRHLIGDSQWVAAGVTAPFGYSYAYPVADKHAYNGEVAVVYRYDDQGSLHASYADRSRFPTLFEMYSTRFGTFVNNPDLRAERSHYTQIGVDDTLNGTHVVANVFYAKVVDGIVAVPLSPTVSEDENTGAERRTGYEIELSRQIISELKAGANFSALSRKVESGATVPTDTPNHKFFAFAEWRPVEPLKFVASLDIQDKRWLQNAVNQQLYYRGGSFSLVNVKASYQVMPKATIEAGTMNLADRNYEIEDGYHAPGRQYFANVRVTF